MIEEGSQFLCGVLKAGRGALTLTLSRRYAGEGIKVGLSLVRRRCLDRLWRQRREREQKSVSR